MSKFAIDENHIKQKVFVGIPNWHGKGLNGKGLTVFCDDVGGGHAGLVANTVRNVLPQARVLTGGIGYTQKQGEVTSCNIHCVETGEILPFDEFVVKHNVGLINNSTDGGKADKILPIALYMRDKIKEHNLIFCGASGNGGGVKQKYAGACIVVSSAVLEDNGRVRWGYTSTGDTVDFCMFTGYAAGSSFASPFLLGMAGLLRSKYPDITQEEVYDYFREHAMDIEEEGKDVKTGWGLPIMGDPKTTITLKIGNNTMTKDGKIVTLDQPPIIKNSRTLVPLRAIAEGLGCEVGWDGATQTVTIEK